VVATGGGAVLDPDTRAALASRGTVVYLHASVGQQMERTRHSRNRPLLHTDDPASRLREIMGVREPLYRELADYEVDTDGRKVGDVAREIWRLYRDDSNGDT
jgi:shikimate kinase